MCAMSQDAALGSLVDELLTCIATFLPDAASLIAFESVSSRFASVPHEAAWRSLCEKRWEDKPRYRLTEKRHEELNTHMRALSWRRRFATFEVDGRRSSITEEELSSLGWYFNYTPDAGGLGRDTLRRVVFKDGRLAVPDYPHMPYSLVGPAGLVGSRVVASGLRGRPELNGTAGCVLSLDVPAARYAVLFDTGEKLKLSLLNVQPTSPTQRSTLKTPPVTAPQPRRLRASSGRARRLWAARHSQEEMVRPPGAQPPPRLLEPAAASKDARLRRRWPCPPGLPRMVAMPGQGGPPGLP